MAMMDGLLPEYDREMGTTRRLLERVPLEHGDWAPHAKSSTLLQLARHIAAIPGHAARTMTLSEFDASEPRPEPPGVTTIADLLAIFDGNVRDGRAAMVGKTDAELMAPWTFKRDGREMFTMPKAGVLRLMCLSHVIHHRGQLTVYLRLRDVPLPSIYGPSADTAV